MDKNVEDPAWIVFPVLVWHHCPIQVASVGKIKVESRRIGELVTVTILGERTVTMQKRFSTN